MKGRDVRCARLETRGEGGLEDVCRRALADARVEGVDDGGAEHERVAERHHHEPQREANWRRLCCTCEGEANADGAGADGAAEGLGGR